MGPNGQMYGPNGQMYPAQGLYSNGSSLGDGSGHGGGHSEDDYEDDYEDDSDDDCNVGEDDSDSGETDDDDHDSDINEGTVACPLLPSQNYPLLTHSNLGNSSHHERKMGYNGMMAQHHIPPHHQMYSGMMSAPNPMHHPSKKPSLGPGPSQSSPAGPPIDDSKHGIMQHIQQMHQQLMHQQ